MKSIKASTSIVEPMRTPNTAHCQLGQHPTHMYVGVRMGDARVWVGWGISSIVAFQFLNKAGDGGNVDYTRKILAYLP